MILIVNFAKRDTIAQKGVPTLLYALRGLIVDRGQRIIKTINA